MKRNRTALRGSATLIVLALIAAPVAFAPALFGSGPALAQTSPAETETVTPDTTYGPGGNSRVTYREDGRVRLRHLVDATGLVREQYAVDEVGGESWGFFEGLSFSGSINARLTPGTTDRWDLTVWEHGQTVSQQSNLTKDDLDVALSYWHATMRQGAGGSARGASLRVADRPGSGPALAQTTTSPAETETVTPDTTYGPGGNSRVTYREDGRVRLRHLVDATGLVREQYAVDEVGGESWGFFEGLSFSGSINARLTPGTTDRWDLTVWEHGQTVSQQSNLTKDDLDVALSYWHATMRQDTGGSARGASLRVADRPGIALPGGPLPLQPQPGKLIIHCFGDAACERAVGANRGQFDYGIRAPVDDGKGKRDEGKDRPLYERPALPPNRLPYEAPDTVRPD